MMRLSSNMDRRIAHATYKQSQIIVFDERAGGGPYAHCW